MQPDPRQFSAQEKEALRYFARADDQARRDRQDSIFEFGYPGAMRPGRIGHIAWDPAWRVPTVNVIDDLGQRGMLRVERTAHDGRRFALSTDGRDVGADLIENPAW